MSLPHRSGHVHQHAFEHLNALRREGLPVLSRRNMLKASLAGMAGLSVPHLLQARARAASSGRPMQAGKSVILLWMTGGPSQLDTWAPKPDRPLENRGPFSAIATRIPGTFLCEHLPKQAAMLNKFTLIRSVDCRGSNHWPVVMSMALAGGGLRHGQVIGATERDGGQIRERRVTPGDLAATLYRYLDVPLDATYLDTRGRPRHIVEEGTPLAELF